MSVVNYQKSTTKTIEVVDKPGKVTVELTPRQAAVIATVLGNVSGSDEVMDGLRSPFLTQLCGGTELWYDVYANGCVTGTISLSRNIEEHLPK